MRLTAELLKKGPKFVAKGRGEDLLYWEKYLMWEKSRVTGPDTWKPFLGWTMRTNKKWYYNEFPTNHVGNLKAQRIRLCDMPLVKPVIQQDIFLGDKVEVMVGRDKGKIGEVGYVVPERNWCFVEGLHMTIETTSSNEGKKHLKVGKPVMGAEEKPLLTTHEVKLIDPADRKATDIVWRFDENGKVVRVSKRTGRIIPMPTEYLNTWDDYVNASNYAATTKDTTEDIVEKETYTAKMCTFEEDICESMDIEYQPRTKRGYMY